jgi:hypothetical protein
MGGIFTTAKLISKAKTSGTSNNGHCRGISVLSVIGGVR